MKLTLNLASRRYLNRRAINQSYLVLILLLVIVLVFLIVDYRQDQHQTAAYRKNIAELELQLEQLQRDLPIHLTAERIEKQKQEFVQAEAFLQRDAFRWTALFNRLEKLLPAGVSIRSFNPNYAERSLVLNGVAIGLTDLQKLLDNLLADSFQQVFLQNQGRIQVSDGEGGKRTALNFSLKLEGVF